ncbi:Metallo-beta-lactamase superfamily protein [Plantibacter sp. VKM Ac-1784]|uniref:Metallo-beta-lactamase superfamily protein n=1 Tax=Plantibacter elymi (nom. nud.) TaxID=199708 RepID=A0ABY1R745_9MICO|nr:MBL fold metallo-hydrolase [Plantibacter sp. VKM Ac-1784]SMQ58116.1 Metallo-beta-lactamase superfamily protein [Plantibacter sp. VKM Ac-1784]
MYEIDFLPVENEDGSSSKSGDAIVAKFTDPATFSPVVVVVDAGFTPVADQVIEHLDTYHGARSIDLMVSTHPDTDHINGLIGVLEACDVKELMMHLPWKHDTRAASWGNYEKIVQLFDLATSRGVTVTEPFAGVTRFGGAFRVLGPTEEYYRVQLSRSLDEVTSVSLSASGWAGSTLIASATKLVKRVLNWFPSETLTDTDDTSARNNTSVISAIVADDRRFMLTGDSGISALEGAALEYEGAYGAFSTAPLFLFQAPHHGSHHNLGPAILDRILGTPDHPHVPEVSAVVSSAKASEKHPSSKVTNALGRRGAHVSATEGRTLCLSSTPRPGWSSVAPIGPLEEE